MALPIYDYARLSNGPADAAQILTRRGFSDALLDRDLQLPLVRRLQSAGWRVQMQRKPFVLLRRAP